MSAARVCPRCGKEYKYIEKRVIGSNTYLLAVHRTAKGVKKCYLGPERLYRYVEKLHRLEAIAGLKAVDYVEVAIRSLEKLKDALTKGMVPKEIKQKVSEKLYILEYSIEELKQLLQKS